jgi:hypothetical protein
MEPDDLLRSRNARLRKHEMGSLAVLLLAEQEEGMGPDNLLCSRNARSRTPLVGRAQWEPNLVRPQVRSWKSGGRIGQERVSACSGLGG